MKHIYIVLFVLSLCISCKKDNKPAPAPPKPVTPPVINSITIVPAELRVNSLATLRADIKKASNTNGNPVYTWKTSDGFLSNATSPTFKVKDFGKLEVELSIADGGVSVTKTIAIDVAQPDFEISYWNDPADSIISSQKALKRYQQKTNDGSLSFQGSHYEDTNTFYLTNNKFTKAQKHYGMLYPLTEGYLYAYKRVSDTLTTRFGKPVEITETWKSESAKTQYANTRQFAVGLDLLEMVSVWENDRTKVYLRLDNYPGAELYMGVQLRLTATYESKVMK